MKKVTDIFVWMTLGVLLLAQVGSCATVDEGLPQWLVGTIAVCVFLVLAFAFMLVNYYYCEEFYEEPDPENDIFFRVVDDKSGYKNDGFQVDDEMPGTSDERKASVPSVSVESVKDALTEIHHEDVMSTAL